jgi:hypothetical protein
VRDLITRRQLQLSDACVDVDQHIVQGSTADVGLHIHDAILIEVADLCRTNAFTDLSDLAERQCGRTRWTDNQGRQPLPIYCLDSDVKRTITSRVSPDGSSQSPASTPLNPVPPAAVVLPAAGRFPRRSPRYRTPRMCS